MPDRRTDDERTTDAAPDELKPQTKLFYTLFSFRNLCFAYVVYKLRNEN